LDGRQLVAQAFQPVQAMAEACVCKKPPFDRNPVKEFQRREFRRESTRHQFIARAEITIA
jgi:hypothetical protein